MAGVLITAVFVVCAIFAPWLAPYGFAQSSAHGVEFPKVGHPSSAHPFGTDRLFFDVLSRVIWGARTALEVVILSVLFCVVLGVPLGLLSGLLRRLARPGPGADHGRAVRVPVVPAGDRVLVPAHRRLRRQRDRGRRCR